MTEENKSADSQQQTDRPQSNDLLNNVWNYIVRHWCGELSLEVSVWFNSVLLVVIFHIAWLIFLLLISHLEYLKSIYPIPILTYMASFLALCIWLIVGLWRSASGHTVRTGRLFWACIVKYVVCVPVGLFWLFIFSKIFEVSVVFH